MPAIVVLVDAEGAVKEWAQTQGFRAALTAQRSGNAYLLISRVGGPPEDCGRDAPRISAIAHGKTRQEAMNLAVDYANAVFGLISGPFSTGVWCNGAAVDGGPSELADSSGVARFYVEATFFLGPTG